MPIWSGLAPAFNSFVVIFSTLAASVLEREICLSKENQGIRSNFLQVNGSKNHLNRIAVLAFWQKGYFKKKINFTLHCSSTPTNSV